MAASTVSRCERRFGYFLNSASSSFELSRGSNGPLALAAARVPARAAVFALDIGDGALVGGCAEASFSFSSSWSLVSALCILEHFTEQLS